MTSIAPNHERTDAGPPSGSTAPASEPTGSARRSTGLAVQQRPGLPSRPLRIGVVTAFPPGRNSLNEFGYHMVSAMVTNSDIESVVVLADDTDEGPPALNTLPTGPGRRPCSARVAWGFNRLTNLWSLLRSIREARVDAVIYNIQFATFGDSKVAGGLGLLAPALTSATGTPTGVVLHNLSDNVDLTQAGFTNSSIVATVMRTAGRLLTHAILRADYVALTIPRYVDHLRSKYGADNAVLTPHGAFAVVDEPDFGAPEGPKRIMTFGKFGTYKKVDILVEAYRKLLADGHDDIELVIAGTDSPNSQGYLASVADACSDLPNVQFTGYVAEEDVAGLFLSSAVVVFPYSSTTGSSGVLHQAGMYGRAVVLPAIGDFVDVIEDEGFTGSYFETDDADDLTRAIAKLLDDEGLNKEQGRRNYLASVGVPMSDVIDWHLVHLNRAIEDRKSSGRRLRSRLKGSVS